ncbi:MAG: hypothetical protein LBP54_03850 [Campylobacteraceae bacterium]|nr:hypothetical protein [Campylobacteraceae bacterium]
MPCSFLIQWLMMTKRDYDDDFAGSHDGVWFLSFEFPFFYSKSEITLATQMQIPFSIKTLACMRYGRYETMKVSSFVLHS